MNRSIFFGLAAVVALATAPSFAASGALTTTENWEQAARAYSAYAFAGVDAVRTGGTTIGVDYIPYVNGVGDPSGLTSPRYFDAIETGSVVESFGAYLPYVNGMGDPSGLTSPQYPDDTQTGSIGAEQRVDVKGFCEGEGKVLAERLYIGFCHLGNESSFVAAPVR